MNIFVISRHNSGIYYWPAYKMDRICSHKGKLPKCYAKSEIEFVRCEFAWVLGKMLHILRAFRMDAFYFGLEKYPGISRDFPWFPMFPVISHSFPCFLWFPMFSQDFSCYPELCLRGPPTSLLMVEVCLSDMWIVITFVCTEKYAGMMLLFFHSNFPAKSHFKASKRLIKKQSST